jgi:signal peptidase complex subunit 3
MYSVLVRANAIFFYGLTVLGVLSGLAAVSTYALTSPTPTVTLAMDVASQLQTFVPLGRGRTGERATFVFDMDANLSSCFDWNTKQLFAYVTVSWGEGGGDSDEVANNVVVWDKVVRLDARKTRKFRKKANIWHPKKLQKQEGVRINYPLIAPNGKLRGETLTLTLHYDVMPLSGGIHRYAVGSHTFTMPKKYKYKHSQ